MASNVFILYRNRPPAARYRADALCSFLSPHTVVGFDTKYIGRHRQLTAFSARIAYTYVTAAASLPPAATDNLTL